MSQYILCKGKIPLEKLEGVIAYCYPFEEFYNEVCERFWTNETKKDRWTIEIDEYTDIDEYFTEAQRQINNGTKFFETKIYKVLKQLLNYNVEIVMWYSEFYDDIPNVCSEQELFENVFNGITDKSGMCEVYVRYKKIESRLLGMGESYVLD